MKILLIDPLMYAHHIPYFEGLARKLKTSHEVVGIVPEGYETRECRIVHLSLYKEGMIPGNTYYFAYLSWMHCINNIVKTEKPDVVHFLYGDIFYRYFGIGLDFIPSCKLIVTFHQIRRSMIRDLSLRMICRMVDTVVVHTEKLQKDFYALNIKNVEQIEYPYFVGEDIATKEEARAMLGVAPNGAPVLLALGSTRQDKGLDILLEALNQVQNPFYLLIAGNANAFDKQYIDTHAAKYISNVKCILKYLSDEELALSIACSDIVVLPYRKSFDGASGPLGEGVAKGKTIIGSDHGSLGKIIKDNHLGYTFECEKAGKLALVIDSALKKPFELDDNYRHYQDSISVDTFANKYISIYQKKRRENHDNQQ